MRRNLNKPPPSDQAQVVKSWSELAAVTGINEKTWRNHSKRPGFPAKTATGYDVLACMEWRRKNINEKSDATANGAGLNAKREAKLDEEIELLRLKIAREKRSVIDAGALDQFHLTLATKQRSALQAKLVTELNPKLDVGAAERLILLERVVDEICEIMREGFDEWARQ